MSVAEAIVLSLFLLLPGWLSLGIGVACLVVAAWPARRNRYVR